jgi:hypothetical protein
VPSSGKQRRPRAHLSRSEEGAARTSDSPYSGLPVQVVFPFTPIESLQGSRRVGGAVRGSAGRGRGRGRVAGGTRLAALSPGRAQGAGSCGARGPARVQLRPPARCSWAVWPVAAAGRGRAAPRPAVCAC